MGSRAGLDALKRKKTYCHIHTCIYIYIYIYIFAGPVNKNLHCNISYGLTSLGLWTHTQVISLPSEHNPSVKGYMNKTAFPH
jgi:hypothetical protein